MKIYEITYEFENKEYVAIIRASDERNARHWFYFWHKKECTITSINEKHRDYK